MYLDQNELYLPSDIQAQLNNTYPALNFTALSGPQNVTGTAILFDIPSPLLLSNLEQLNALGDCTQFGTCPIYLTSKDNITANPPWLYGVLPNPVTLETVGARSCAIIVNDHGDGIVDAFYMYFYAFNLGENIYGQVLGDHVGDWEHSMVRFVNETPSAVWLSQHSVSFKTNPARSNAILTPVSMGRHSHMNLFRRMVQDLSFTAQSAHTPTSLSQAYMPEISGHCN